MASSITSGRLSLPWKFTRGATPLNGDIVFNGDLDGWIRLANSLRFKALMRISAVRDVAAELQELYDLGAGAGAELIRNNAENATFDFAAGPPNSFAFATARIGIFNVFLMSETAEEILTGLDDPRAGVLYRPSAANGDFNGIINGIDASSAIVPDQFARPGTIWREHTGDLDFNYLNRLGGRLPAGRSSPHGIHHGRRPEPL
jgi:hypothetical protein